MECLRAREIASEAFDSGVANVPEAAEAREHCRSCPECRAFVEGLGMLEKVPPPIAPPYLVEEIVERSRRMAAANLPPIVGRKPADDASADAPAEADDPLVEMPVVLTAVPRPRTWTAGRLTALAAAVLIGVFALSLSLQGFQSLKSRSTAGSRTAEPAFLNGGAEVGGGTGAPAQSFGESATKDLAASSGTRYVSFESHAYFWLGPRTPDAGTLTAVGTLTSALDTTSTPDQHEVWRSKSDGDVIFIRPDTEQETYVAFRRATRTLGGKVFALYAGELNAYGMWPALPSQYATPTADDGSPTFTSAGKDDSGLEIYAPNGAVASAGFAVAPNTTPGDPAGGSPNWTWWVPRP